MKKTILLCAALCGFLAGHAQTRFVDKMFDVDTISGIKYGSNTNAFGFVLDLVFDIYQPKGDNKVNRPLLIFAHGGSFTGGNTKDSDAVYLCREFARRGYVTASIEYRLGVNPFSGKPLENEVAYAVWRGTQDARALVRYFRKSVISGGDPYRIDPNNIFFAGSSAGALIALHLAYLDDPAELAQTVIDTAYLGGVEGSTGSPGYDWRVRGIITLSGAIGDVRWMYNNKNVPICAVHGVYDATIPYGSGYYKFNNQNVAYLQGGFSIDSAAKLNAVDSRLLSFEAGHRPFYNNPSTNGYMDTTERFIRDFLFEKKGVFNGEKEREVLDFELYPNPANQFIEISAARSFSAQLQIKLVDLTGKELISSSETKINISDLKPGVYLVEVRDGNAVGHKKLLTY